jgi:hypothetical protein
MADKIHVTTGEARLSYVHLLQPYAREAGQKERYGVTVLVPKADVATKQRIDAAIEAAMQDGAARLWSGKRYTIHPLWDGDGLNASGQPFGPECKGHWVFTAGADPQYKPRVVDANLQDILDPTKIYSGVYGRVGIDVYPYNNPNKKGVGFGLVNVQILHDGEPLGGGSVSPEDDFGAADPAYYAPPVQQHYPQYVGTPPQQPYAPSGYGAVPPQYSTPAQGYPYPQQQVDPLTGLPF